ncbi:MAG TPA: glycosyltransferase [Candidatus Kapabacteria bacterium]|nr:glycosyltransferase [Candidatus Kapabacteria bacterium]
MIFVTVGTHEQPFDRLVKAMDELKQENTISQEVFIQSGYSTYKPRFCDYAGFIGFNEMLERMAAAEIVITHGGTGSIMLVLYHHKIPLVMPRQKQYNEHIDNHQVQFCRMMASKGKIIAAYEVEELGAAINNYHQMRQGIHNQWTPGGGEIVDDLSQRSRLFARKLNELCRQKGMPFKPFF